MITDAAGVIQYVNPALENITGCDRLELIGNNPRKYLKSGEHDESFYKQLWDTIYNREDLVRTYHQQEERR